mmetsp:Transcript_55024/g.116949  ORF Transcript_55024/g.116949 Transcript_55024/m.116949 type:complete len:233 (-) Transcript_55024:254-952(-)
MSHTTASASWDGLAQNCLIDSPTDAREGGQRMSNGTSALHSSFATTLRPSSRKLPCRKVSDMSAGLGGAPPSPSLASSSGGGGNAYTTRSGTSFCTARLCANDNAQLSTVRTSLIIQNTTQGLSNDSFSRGNGVFSVSNLLLVWSKSSMMRESGACGIVGVSSILAPFLAKDFLLPFFADGILAFCFVFVLRFVPFFLVKDLRLVVTTLGFSWSLANRCDGRWWHDGANRDE